MISKFPRDVPTYRWSLKTLIGPITLNWVLSAVQDSVPTRNHESAGGGTLGGMT